MTTVARTTRFVSSDDDVDALYEQLAQNNLQPLWELPGLLTPQPTPRAVPYVWPTHDLTRLARMCGEFIPVERGGDRRVIACSNPGLDGAPYAVGTLWAAVQYLKAGESAPPHRHTPGALRFVLDGSSVWTGVDGDAISMSAGDLVLTPSWTYHEHVNAGDRAMMWLDILDLPLVSTLDAVFFERGLPGAALAYTPMSRSEHDFGGGPGLLPGDAATLNATHSPLLAYRWADTERALRRQLADGARIAHVRYSDPTSGRDVMPTMRCEIRRMPAGVATASARQTGGRVGCVLHGRGTIAIGDERFALEPGDIVAIPSWHVVTIEAQDELDFFTTSDAPVLIALGLYREEAVLA